MVGPNLGLQMDFGTALINSIIRRVLETEKPHRPKDKQLPLRAGVSYCLFKHIIDGIEPSTTIEETMPYVG
jgi:hypothetical protein